MELESFISCLQNVTPSGNGGYMASCPVHGDNTPSLSVGLSGDGSKILVHCYAGCAFSEIIEAMGLTVRDLFTRPNKSGRNTTRSKMSELPATCSKKSKLPAPVCSAPQPAQVRTAAQKLPRVFLREHIYHDISGNVIAKKQIYSDGKGGKSAIWRRYECGRYITGLDKLTAPLYNLPALIRSTGDIYISEGEKDADTLTKMGFTAASSPNGAGAAWRGEQYNRFFEGRNVVILTDNDNAGRKSGNNTAAALTGTAATVKLIPATAIYPHVAAKGDISDIAAIVGAVEAKRLLLAAVERAEVYTGRASAAGA